MCCWLWWLIWNSNLWIKIAFNGRFFNGSSCMRVRKMQIKIIRVQLDLYLLCTREWMSSPLMVLLGQFATIQRVRSDLQSDVSFSDSMFQSFSKLPDIQQASIIQIMLKYRKMVHSHARTVRQVWWNNCRSSDQIVCNNCNFRLGFYADMETRCQVWHWCIHSGMKYDFLCPNATVFNQQTRVCDWFYNVDCFQAESYYLNNDDLYKDTDGNPIWMWRLKICILRT